MRSLPLLAAIVALASCGTQQAASTTPATSAQAQPALAGLAAPPLQDGRVLITVPEFLTSTTSHGGFQFNDIGAPQPDPASPGSFIPKPCRTGVTVPLPQGSVQTLIAYPDAGYHVIWTGTDNDASASNTNTFHVNSVNGQKVTVGFSL